jgi:hypothetical protein
MSTIEQRKFGRGSIFPSAGLKRFGELLPHMTRTASPATRLHDVEVVNEQSGVRWRAGTATIDGGQIVVKPSAATRPPAGMLANSTNTFSIAALDGGNRARLFQNVTLDREASTPKSRYVFR